MPKDDTLIPVSGHEVHMAIGRRRESGKNTMPRPRRPVRPRSLNVRKVPSISGADISKFRSSAVRPTEQLFLAVRHGYDQPASRRLAVLLAPDAQPVIGVWGAAEQ